MKIVLDITKSVEENAQGYFEKAKKLRKKIDGICEAIALHEKKLKEISEKKEEDAQAIAHQKEQHKKRKAIKKEWYEKFKWFISSEGFLCIAGTDATTNEIVVKKHTDPTDKVLHTDMSGSPFVIVKSEGKEVGEQTLNEAAQFVAVYSRAWKMGMSAIEVFWVNPEQVSKTPNSGESLAKGAFVIRGKTNYLKPQMNICIGISEGKIIAGTESVMKTHAERYCLITQGNDKTSDLAKRIKSKLGDCVLDDIIRFIPAGGAKLERFEEK